GGRGGGGEGGGGGVGGDAELAVLEAGVDDALAGRGRLFLLVGPAGAGKTKLADELASRAKARGVAVRWGRGWDGGDAPPYWPWRQAIRGLPENGGAATVGDLTGGTPAVRGAG